MALTRESSLEYQLLETDRHSPEPGSMRNQVNFLGGSIPNCRHVVNARSGSLGFSGNAEQNQFLFGYVTQSRNHLNGHMSKNCKQLGSIGRNAFEDLGFTQKAFALCIGQFVNILTYPHKWEC
jgi:hypothetical protein